MKYRYSRKEIAEILKAKRYKNLAQSICDDLLSTLPERESRYLPNTKEWCDERCKKSSPSLDGLEIEEIYLNGRFTKEKLIQIGFDKTNEIIKSLNAIIKKLKSL